jgi:hypothetical protein
MVRAYAPPAVELNSKTPWSSTKRVRTLHTREEPLCGRFNMANFNHERVSHALNELLVRIVPDDPEEDEEAANQRFEEAFDFAFNELEAAGDPEVVEDLNHVASLIDKKSIAS